MRRHTFLLRLPVFLPLLLLAPPVTGAEGSSALTLNDVLSRVAERHPGLAARAFDERAAGALAEQAAQGPRPTVEIGLENAFGTGRLQGVRSLEATVQATRTWERGDKREKRGAVAAASRELTVQEISVQRAELLATAATAYVFATVAEQRHALAREALTLAQAGADALQRRTQAGAATTGESARARAAVGLARAELTRAEHAAASARSALAATWGGSPAEVPRVAPALNLAAGAPDEAALRAQLATHPRLAVQAAAISARRAQLALEQAQATADVTAQGGLRFLREGTAVGFVAGLSVPLPTRERNQGAIRAARESLAGAEQGARAIETELATQFTAAWLDFTAARATARALRSEALPAATEAEALLRRDHAAGAVSLLEIIEAQRALVALRLEIATAEATAALALVRLDALTDRRFPLTSALFATP